MCVVDFIQGAASPTVAATIRLIMWTVNAWTKPNTTTVASGDLVNMKEFVVSRLLLKKG